jgi:hypothetical protein
MQTLGSNLVLNELIVIPDGPWKGYQGFVVERGNDYRLIQLVGKNIAIKV